MKFAWSILLRQMCLHEGICSFWQCGYYSKLINTLLYISFFKITQDNYLVRPNIFIIFQILWSIILYFRNSCVNDFWKNTPEFVFNCSIVLCYKSIIPELKSKLLFSFIPGWSDLLRCPLCIFLCCCRDGTAATATKADMTYCNNFVSWIMIWLSGYVSKNIIFP